MDSKLQQLFNCSGSTREAKVAKLLEENYLPSWLQPQNQKFCPITVINGPDTLVYNVLPDYLALGTDEEWMYIPMSPLTAKKWMQTNNLSFPTKTMVNQIHHQAKIKLTPPISWNALYDHATKKYNRDSTECFKAQSDKLQEMLKKHTEYSHGDLAASHKKDVVLTDYLLTKANQNNVAIYGWFNSDSSVVQNLNPSSHSVSYIDYSHGLRMISNNCVLNGQQTTIQAVWNDLNHCKLLHDAPLKFQSY